MRARVFLPLLLLALGTTSCRYAVDRALDFADQFRLVVGASTGAGFRASFAGLYHTGLQFGIKPHASSLGWKYGRLDAFTLNKSSDFPRFDADQSLVYRTTSLIDADYRTAEVGLARTSYGLLPALFTWVDSTPDEPSWEVPEEGDGFRSAYYLWSADAWARSRYAMIHAFGHRAGDLRPALPGYGV